MDEAIKSLNNAIESASSLINGIKPEINSEEIEEFSQLCQKCVEIQTRYQLIKKIENCSSLPDDISESDIEKAQSENEKIRHQIQDLQQSNEDIIDPEQLKGLIEESRQTLQELQEKIGKGGDPKIDQLTKSAQEELSHLEQASKENEWYKAAYAKLSSFTGITINDDNSIQIFGTHRVAFTSDDHVILDPPSVSVSDLDPSQEPHNIIISEIIERLASLRDMKDLAKKLNWEIDSSSDAPIVFLHPPPGVTKTQLPATFALIGYNVHPLIKWGDVNVDEFNSMEGKSMYEKMKIFEKNA